jgi:hypothetical protein
MVAFVYGSKLQDNSLYIALEVLIDAYWILDVVFKATLFSFHQDFVSKKLVIDPEMIWQRYYKSYFWIDLVSSIPIEMIILFPNFNKTSLYMSRASHLLRVGQLNNYSEMVERHIKYKFGVIFDRTTSLLLKAGYAYVVLVHWLASVYFVIHRFSESDYKMTYVIADGLAHYDPVLGKHDICSSRISHCYARSIYFVLGTMTSIGYGDISPYTNKEIVWEQVVAISGAFIAAIFLTFIGTYQVDHDARDENAFKLKLIEIDNYLKFRKLPSNLGKSIIAQFHFQWNKHGSLSGEKNIFIAPLSDATKMEILLQLNNDIMTTVPILNDAPHVLRRRIAAKLKEQVRTMDSLLLLLLTSLFALTLSLVYNRLC